MTLFLTSSPSGCPFEPGPDIPVLDTRNHFVANLRAVWPDHAVLGLAIAADPYAYEQNDEMCRVFAQSLSLIHIFNGDKGCDEVVHQNDDQPEQGGGQHAGHCLLYTSYPCSWILTALAEIAYFASCYKRAMAIFRKPAAA